MVGVRCMFWRNLQLHSNWESPFLQNSGTRFLLCQNHLQNCQLIFSILHCHIRSSHSDDFRISLVRYIRLHFWAEFLKDFHELLSLGSRVTKPDRIRNESIGGKRKWGKSQRKSRKGGWSGVPCGHMMQREALCRKDGDGKRSTREKESIREDGWNSVWDCRGRKCMTWDTYRRVSSNTDTT